MNATERLSFLRAQSFEYLSKLPGVTEEEIIIDKKKGKLAVWHDELTPGQHRIVVATYKPTRLRLGWHVRADGFVVNDKNEQRPLTPDELSAFT